MTIVDVQLEYGRLRRSQIAEQMHTDHDILIYAMYNQRDCLLVLPSREPFTGVCFHKMPSTKPFVELEALGYFNPSKFQFVRTKSGVKRDSSEISPSPDLFLQRLQ